MGFSGIIKPASAAKPSINGLQIDFLHKHECQVCPLNKLAGVKTPHMEPIGSDSPLIYVLGPAPTKADDKYGAPFSRSIGNYIRERIPEELHDEIRWNNVVRTWPQRQLEPAEIECCRPSIIRDIEETQPKAIFGIGPVPLKWTLGENTISYWNGRHVPVKIGNHTCWYFPMLDPDYIQWRLDEKPGEGRGLAFTFDMDMRRALALLDELPEPVVHTQDQAIADIECITGENGWQDVERVKHLLQRTWDSSIAGFDYETKRVRPYATDAKILTLAMSTKAETFAFALQHKQAKWTDEQYEAVYDAVHKFLEQSPVRKISHNLPFELEWTALFFGHKAIRRKTWGDSIGGSYILDERPKTHDLGFMTLQYFGLDIKLIDNLDKNRLDDEPLSQVLRYNGLDARYHRLVYLREVADLKREKLWDVYQHQLARAHAAVLTQIKGIPTDQAAVREFSKQYQKEMRKQERLLADLPTVQRFRKSKGFDYRPSNTHDCKFIIQKILKLDFDKADEEVLQQIKDPFAKHTLLWRKAAKLYSTYVKPWDAQQEKSNVWPDGLIHHELKITSVRTWRTSAKGPNVQNNPKRNEGKIVRKQVRGTANQRVVAFDYAGMQARNVAMESKDRNLVKYFWEKYDIHTDWTNRLLKYYPKWIDEGIKAIRGDDKAAKDLFKSYRNRTKNEFVFPSFFGAIPKSVAGYLGIPIEIAEKLHGDFWDEFPDIKNWHEGLFKFYEEHGYVTGLSGFRRRAPISPNELINSPIQGDESIIVMSAMCALSELGYMRYQPNIEVHDDLTFIWEFKEIEKNAEVVVREMIKKRFPWINVPLVVEMSVGKDWYNLEAIGEFSSADWDGKVRYTLEDRDPNGGAWGDGTGWSNHKQNENATKRRNK